MWKIWKTLYLDILNNNPPVTKIKIKGNNLPFITSKFITTWLIITVSSITQVDLDNSLKEKYTDYNKHKLKKCLRLLKANEPENLNEIRFVSKLLTSKIQTEQSSVTKTLTNINQNELIKSDFWKYFKRFIEQAKKILPIFNQIVCTEYFRKTLQSINLGYRPLKPQHTSMTSPLPRIKRSQK